MRLALTVAVASLGLFVHFLVAQPTSAGAASVPASAPGQVTIKGVILSTWHFYKHKLPKNQSPKDSSEHFDLVLYAFDGPPEVQKALQDALSKWPKDGVDAKAAAAFQQAMDRDLLYYVDTGNAEETAKLTYGYTWVNALAAVTGTVQKRDGKRWLTGAKVAVESYKAKVTSDKPQQLSFKYPPDCMLAADKPLAMSKEKPIELKIADGISLACVPIPPGTFIMGSPFYQVPRYQDECPHEVELTRTFFFSETPITQEMWEAVMGKDANRSKHKGAKLAAENCPFPDIRKFCQVLSEKNGRTVRVPTAAELEYVARLGNSGPCFPVKYFPLRTNVAGKEPAEVKQGKPSAWGVYDLPAYGITAVSDWKAPNRPDRQVDPQGEPFDSPWVYYDKAILSAQKPDKAIEGMILKPPYNYPAVHKGASGLDWDRPNLHDRYGEDGLDGGNGPSWIGIVRLVVEFDRPTSAPASAPTKAK